MSDAQTLIDRWLPQVRKGLLEMLILELLDQRTSYGYEIAQRLRGVLEAEIAEGTLYPLLKRLSRDLMVTNEWITEAGGAPRKYYAITPEGRDVLRRMRAELERIHRARKELLK
ncbi:PadR family transcriptional regulator [Pseudomarimonas salicorniae]|uniref:PadR family transcriptional regulator n=1 Tax=Pseudomarimonas salicorniae TaxID=2933270 RepID=A0ABT0GC50_9GAMM|nr:PadR family transcriptional regulator [Lysobacter sp. CAU 1642]MCK7592120.1 PadR family transcriptional regulator [Lysobacter sp. CAU 1642]